MKPTSSTARVLRTVATLVLATFNLSAARLYVSLESANPMPPFATWATAATVIQDAVDAATAGDTVLVTNGVYAVGSKEATAFNVDWRVFVGLSRIVVTNSIRLESVNGPSLTIVQGAQPNENGEGAMRCVYLGTNAVISGFTLTKGYAGHSGGMIDGAAGGGILCEPSAVVTNCFIHGNRIKPGYWGLAHGGGVYGGVLYGCTVAENEAPRSYRLMPSHGAGVAYATLHNCLLSGNSTGKGEGGGAYQATLNNCTLTGNSATGGGGGAASSTLYNCTLSGNSDGGLDCTLYNCTVVGNGFGVSGTVFNSILYYNAGGNYAEDTTLNSCCTSPLPTNGIGNVAGPPLFMDMAAGDFRLREDSPCIDAGTNLLGVTFTYHTLTYDPDTGQEIMGVYHITDSTDILGNSRFIDGNADGKADWDIGAYEFRPSPLTLYVSLQSTNPVVPYGTWETAATNIQDAVDAAKAGDTVLVTNGVYATGGKTDEWEGFFPGSRVAVSSSIRLESVNGPLVTIVQGTPPDDHWDWQMVMRCVYLGSNAVISGFTLTNGYAYGGGGGGVRCEPSAVVTNCILRGNSVHRGGFNNKGGGGVYGGTLYDCTLDANSTSGGSHGGGAHGSTLYNCTLTRNDIGGTIGGPTGGGAYECILYDCTLVGNSANIGGGAAYSALYRCTLTGNWAGSGGGAYNSILYGCLLTANSAFDGGGAGRSALYNCTITGNSGTGASGSTLFNSIVYYNSGGNYVEGTALNYCCTTPLPTNGVNNITGPPLFMDMAAGDFRLPEDSPCVDAGTNLLGFPITAWRYVEEKGDYDWVVVGHITAPTDILGNTRFIDGNGDGTVAWDIGAYEFNSFRPPRFSIAPQLTLNGCLLNITGAPNKWVRLLRSGNLKDWEDVWTDRGFSFFMGSEGVMQVTDRDTGPTAMFYRVIVQ